MGQYLSDCFVYSPDAIFREIMIMAWARSRTPVVCTCYVVACFKFMPSISATSSITWENACCQL